MPTVPRSLGAEVHVNQQLHHPQLRFPWHRANSPSDWPRSASCPVELGSRLTRASFQTCGRTQPGVQAATFNKKAPATYACVRACGNSTIPPRGACNECTAGRPPKEYAVTVGEGKDDAPDTCFATIDSRVRVWCRAACRPALQRGSSEAQRSHCRASAWQSHVHCRQRRIAACCSEHAESMRLPGANVNKHMVVPSPPAPLDIAWQTPGGARVGLELGGPMTRVEDKCCALSLPPAQVRRKACEATGIRAQRSAPYSRNSPDERQQRKPGRRSTKPPPAER